MKLFEHPDFEQAILRAEEHFRARGLRPAAFTADSASGLRLEVYGFRFTASGLRADSAVRNANPLFTGKNDPKLSDFCP